MGHTVTEERIAKARAFSRFYTNHVGALRAGLLDSPWSLTEARVLYELAQADAVEVADLRETLDMDGGQLSRLLSRFHADRLITRGPSAHDARRQVIALTTEGRRAALLLDSRAVRQMRDWLAHLEPADQDRLIAAMDTVRTLFGPGDPAPGSPGGRVTLRELRPGDLGWVVARHGALYAAEYGWDSTFEALIAQIVADYGRTARTDSDHAWIAELGGRPVGSVFCVRSDATTAKLRLLLVEPDARGHGAGSLLVRRCLDFAREAGYRTMTLWTNDCLTAARRVYEREGFTLVHSEPHHSFGQDLVGQTWERAL